MSRFLLDTHTLVYWLVRPARLSRRALKELSDERNVFSLSVMSAFEIRLLNEIRRIDLPVSEVLAYVRSESNFSLLPFDELVLNTVVDLSTRDPFDRVILGTAMAHGLKILTADQWMSDHFPKQVLW